MMYCIDFEMIPIQCQQFTGHKVVRPQRLFLVLQVWNYCFIALKVPAQELFQFFNILFVGYPIHL